MTEREVENEIARLKKFFARQLDKHKPIARRGWDNITIDGAIAYCRGDILVYRIQAPTEKWAIKHPLFTSLRNETFESPITAMQAVEAYLK